MPDFAIVSLEYAKLQTTSQRQREYLNEYAGYIQQLSHGMAGMLRPGEDEKLPTIRRRLIAAAKMLGIDLVIKRSGQDIYFWTAELEEAKPRPRRGGRRRRQAETETPGQYFSPDQIGVSETGELDHEQIEDSPELGQAS